MLDKNFIKSQVDAYFSEIVEIRRHIHQHPEIAFQEFETAKYICSKLDEFGIKFETGIAQTGTIGWIYGKNPEKKLIALRADIDALPIIEENDIEYCSVNKGTMHACGHDAHTACLLGAAKILQTLRDSFEGTIMLIFQPGEERLPGGARLMLEAGIFNEHKPELIIAQHVLPDLECGSVGMKPGIYMASSDEINIIVTGKGGHGATPHQLIDTVLVASHIVVALQQIVSRNADAAIPTVLSFGKVTANGATNIIPNEVKLEGTFRTMNEIWRKDAHSKMKKLAQSIAEGMGAECEFVVKNGYPMLENSVILTPQAFDFAKNFLGEENTKVLDLRMTSEDFAFFAKEIPGVYYRLGVKRENTPIYHLHTSHFNINEQALKTGTGFMIWLALNFLETSN
jgi:amidohydrolase